ncbi:MAG: hypothetical protein IPK87_09265 [Planctomycetes bacterium]|nr:hypothetical protein [Planctomycetota bacterium]
MSNQKKQPIVAFKLSQSLLQFMEEAEREASSWPAWRQKNFGSTVQTSATKHQFVVIHKRKKGKKQAEKKHQLAV